MRIRKMDRKTTRAVKRTATSRAIAAKVERQKRAAARAKKAADAKRAILEKIESEKRAATAKSALAKKWADAAKRLAEAAAKKAAQARKIAAQKVKEARKATKAKRPGAIKKAATAKKVAATAAQQAKAKKAQASKKEVVARVASRKQLSESKKLLAAEDTARRKQARANRKAVEARYERRRLTTERKLDKTEILKRLRKWRPFFKRLKTIGKRLRKPENNKQFVELIQKVVPKKGHRKGELSGKEAKDAVDAMLKRLRINLQSLEKTASRVGIGSTLLLGVAGEATFGLGIEGAAGLAYTFRSKHLRWYTSVGKVVSLLPGEVFNNLEANLKGLIQIGFMEGGPENQKGPIYDMQLSVSSKLVYDLGLGGNAFIGDKSLIPIGGAFCIGWMPDTKVFPFDVDITLTIGEGKTGTIYNWSKPKAKPKSKPNTTPTRPRRPRGRVRVY